ncbi:Dos2-interacting transcription regulator of RNA-Pol-II-domain-containing protein [Syncephalis fuscata]|nr:Dos2-interacting transcription regulator of RNA-Pol-II-domain-containing protein [Syncephalis fuscata]
MTTVPQAVAAYWSQGMAAQAAEDIVVAINTEENNSILLMIQALQPQLTSEQSSERIQGIELLNTVLDKCDTHRVTTSIARVLIEFYVNRLDTDEACLETMLTGLLIFERFSTLETDQIEKIIVALLQLNVQRYPQTTRYVVFRLMDWLITNYASALASKSPSSLDVVLGFIKIMDGEKDPRNLLLAFSVSQKLIQTFDVTQHAEELFEILFCYFPITFRPPPHDPYGITADDLKLALRNSLAATPLFGPMALPMLIEKLSSSLGSAKKDALDTIAACAPIYGVTLLIEHFDTLWRLIQAEIFNAMDDSVTESACHTLRSLATVMSRANQEASPSPATLLLNAALDTINSELASTSSSSNENQRYKAISQIIRSIGGATSTLLEKLCQQLIPSIIMQYQGEDIPVTRKRSFLLVLGSFLEAGQDIYGELVPVDISDEVMETVQPAVALIPFKESMMQLFGTAYTSTAEYDQLRHTGLEGVKHLLFISGLLLPNEAGIMVQQIIHVILDQLTSMVEEEPGELRSKSIEILTQYTLHRPMVVKDVAFQPCIAQLSEAIMLSTADASIDKDIPRQIKAKIQMALHVMAACAVTRYLFEDVLLQWLDIIDHLDTRISDDTKQSANQWLLIQLLQSILRVYQSAETRISNDTPSTGPIIPASIYPTMLLFLLSKIIEPTLCSNANTGHGNSLFADSTVISTTAHLLGEGMRLLDNEQLQQTVLNQIMTLFMQGDLSGLTLVSQQSTTPFIPLQKGALIEQQNTVPLLAALLNHCRPAVKIPVESTSSFLFQLLEVGCDDQTTTVNSQALAQMSASIINKMDTKQREALLNDWFQSIKQRLYDQQLSINGRRAALVFLLWSTRAFALLAHPMAREMTIQIIECFKESDLAQDASHGFSIITQSHQQQQETADCLTADQRTFTVTKLLHRQKFFMYALPMITQGFHEASDDTRVYYLIALSHLLSNVPKQIMLEALPPVILLI